MNVPLTNILNAVRLGRRSIILVPRIFDQNSFNGASNSTYTTTNSVLQTLTYNVTNAQGQLQLLLKPSANYIGPVSPIFYVSSSPIGPLFPALRFAALRFQLSFTFGDTPISAQGTNFTAFALMPFTNQLLATFTNGVPNSPTNNFTAFINWGDNSTNSGVIVTNLNGRKEVLGSHTYTNAGDYPIYLTIQSTFGASATVVSTAMFRPALSLARAGATKCRQLAGLGDRLSIAIQHQPVGGKLAGGHQFLRADGLSKRRYQQHDRRQSLLPAQKIRAGNVL